MANSRPGEARWRWRRSLPEKRAETREKEIDLPQKAGGTWVLLGGTWRGTGRRLGVTGWHCVMCDVCSIHIHCDVLTPPLTLLLALVETVGRVLVRVDNPMIVARCLCSEASRGFRRTAMLPAQLLERFSAQSTRASNYLASLYQRDARAALAVCCCSCCFGPARRGRSVGLPRELELQNLLRA